MVSFSASPPQIISKYNNYTFASVYSACLYNSELTHNSSCVQYSTTESSFIKQLYISTEKGHWKLKTRLAPNYKTIV